MICNYFYLNTCGFQLGSLLFKTSDNNQQLLVINLIIAFSRIQIFRKEGNRM